MKLRNILPALALSALLLTSCDDQIMNWYKDPTHGEMASSELPLGLAEKITRYKELNTYTNFVLGIGIDLTLYMENETYRDIINANFDEATIGYDMKHGAMVNSAGVINYTKVDALLVKLKEAGLTVYGHTLVWHSNQNAAYLNGLIAATVIPGSTGTNVLTNGDFENGATGWGSWGGGKTSVAVATDVKLAGTTSLKVVTSATSKNEWDVQVQAPAVTLVPGHQYEISFWVKSEGAGGVRLSFGDAAQMNNQYPSLKSGGGLATTSTAWKQVVYSTSTIDATTNFTAVGTTMSFRLDFGKIPSMTYYLDNVTVVDLDAVPTNMVSNGTFDAGVTGWSAWNGGASVLTAATTAQAYQGAGAMQVVNATSNSGGQWKVQIHSNFTSSTLPAGTYVVSYFVRSNAAGSIRCSTTGNALYQGDQATSSTWKQVQWEITATGAETGLNFDLGLTAGTYFIDNVTVYDKSKIVVTTAPVTIEKTAAEKTTIIGNAMTSWITNMMTHYKADVKAWDVVNEPMNEDGTVRDGSAATTASDVFYWVKYLGKDFAVTAFKLARQYGNTTDKLFINDYNLEYSLAKCDGLVEYVKYIESKGATVDGIGTQMHIDINTDTLKIDQMFKKLAASGKLIKVTELDVKVNTATPTIDNYATQAKIYKFVVDSYMKNIPETQRYGITAWGVSDAVKEHVNWIPDDGPCLWDKNYARKHAFKGFADGLAGKDVSKDFSGDLQY
jgi:endo-1,4-beta-xylanase